MILNAKRTGEGEPLVLIHGLFGSLENLGAIARPLAEHFSVYALDLPNHGRSPRADDMSLSAMAHEVHRWMDAEGLEQAHFLGHSLGGKVAMELALKQSERVKRLVVVDIAPVHYPPHHDGVFEGLLSLDIDHLQSRSEADKQLAQYVDELPVRSFLLKNLTKTDAGYSWRINLPAIHREYPKLVTHNREGCFEGEVLFIKGGNSDYIREAHRDEILERFPKAAVKVVPETGHWLHAEKPELVARLAERFLNAANSAHS